MSEVGTSMHTIRPLDARRRAAIRHWVPRGTAVFLLAVLTVAIPPSGPGSWSPGMVVLALMAAAPFVVAYLYVRNVSIGLEAGRIIWTDLTGRRHSEAQDSVTEVVGRRCWIGPLAVDVVALRAGQRDVLRLPRSAWNLDAVEAFADRLAVPIHNAETASRAASGARRLAG